MKTNSPVARSLFATLVARINLPHLLMEKDAGNDIQPFEKLLTKQLAFLRGELKSQANLIRFHDDFDLWRQQRDSDDSLAARITELCCAALHSAVETLLDPECDDTALLIGNIGDLHDEMDALGANTEGLRQYWQDIQNEFNAEFANLKQLPVNKGYFQWLIEMDVSLFGVSE